MPRLLLLLLRNRPIVASLRVLTGRGRIGGCATSLRLELEGTMSALLRHWLRVNMRWRRYILRCLELLCRLRQSPCRRGAADAVTRMRHAFKVPEWWLLYL